MVGIPPFPGLDYAFDAHDSGAHDSGAHAFGAHASYDLPTLYGQIELDLFVCGSPLLHWGLDTRK